MTTPTQTAATAELNGLAAAACTLPTKTEGVVVGRCGECATCRQHDRMMARLGWLRWLRQRAHPEETRP